MRTALRGGIVVVTMLLPLLAGAAQEQPANDVAPAQQEPAQPELQQPEPPAPDQPPEPVAAPAQPLRADDLMSYSVYNYEGEELGRISDLVLDPNQGNIRYVIVSFGGFLGMGEKLFAVPWQRLTIQPETQKALLNVRRQTLKRARGFDTDQWPRQP